MRHFKDHIKPANVIIRQFDAKGKPLVTDTWVFDEAIYELHVLAYDVRLRKCTQMEYQLLN